MYSSPEPGARGYRPEAVCPRRRQGCAGPGGWAGEEPRMPGPQLRKVELEVGGGGGGQETGPHR